MIELVGTGCLLIAAWCWWRSLRSIARGVRSRSWPVASGVIRSARVRKKFNSKAREVWRQDVEYSYSIGGEAYRGTRIQFGIPNALSWSDPSRPSFRAFRPGASVDVFHSPSRPAVSALQRGFSPFVFITLAGGGLMAWVGFRLLTLPG